ncbi:MAG TPA: STAS domain-containing protein [Candidatus Udaeobacter sp.]|nr:STAS domain-containing protein [Candidatus Udaeobacter sp.]
MTSSKEPQPHLLNAADIPVLKMSGVMNVDTVRPFSDEVLRALKSAQWCLVIEMSDLESLTGGAMGALLLKQSEAERHGGSIKLAAVPEPIRTILSSSGLAEVFKIHSTVDDAKQALLGNRRRPRVA